MSTLRNVYTSFIPQPGDPFLGVRTLLQADETSDIMVVFRYSTIGFEERFACSTRLLRACSDYFAHLLDLKDVLDTGLKQQDTDGDNSMPVLTIDLPTFEFAQYWVISRIKCIICGVLDLRLQSGDNKKTLRREEYHTNYHVHDIACRNALDGCIMNDCSNFFMFHESSKKLDLAFEFGSVTAKFTYESEPRDSGDRKLNGNAIVGIYDLGTIECQKRFRYDRKNFQVPPHLFFAKNSEETQQLFEKYA